MNKRIFLNDMDRPNEGLEVIVEHSGEKVLTLAVPNTIVKFQLRRADVSQPFKGELGGRWFTFTPPPRVAVPKRAG